MKASPVKGIAEGVWVFRSRFAEMLSTLVAVGGGRGILVDPPMFAPEAEAIRRLAEREGITITWLAITHAHGDHAYGMVHFPEALVVTHQRFWGFWKEIEAEDRAFFARYLPSYSPPELREPNIRFAEELELVLQRRLTLTHAPGHTPDGITVELSQERILIAGDTVLRIPFISSGRIRELRSTLEGLLKDFGEGLLVPGHGDVVKGKEARDLLEDNIRYLERLENEVREAVRLGEGLEEVERIPLRDFGIPEGAVGGLAAWIHRENLRAAYRELSQRG